MSGESTLAVITALVRSLATDPASDPVLDIRGNNHVRIPGPATQEKADLERELAALVLRVQHLEFKAASANVTTIFPDTPGATPESLFPDGKSSTSSPAGAGKPNNQALPRNGFMDEALEGLREHVDDQSKLLDSQRQELAGVNAQGCRGRWLLHWHWLP